MQHKKKVEKLQKAVTSMGKDLEFLSPDFENAYDICRSHNLPSLLADEIKRKLKMIDVYENLSEAYLLYNSHF